MEAWGHDIIEFGEALSLRCIQDLFYVLQHMFKAILISQWLSHKSTFYRVLHYVLRKEVGSSQE